MPDQDPPVQRHTHGDEEETEQQVAKWLRLGLDHVPVRCFGDDHAAQKRAECEGQPRTAGGGCRRQDHQQRSGSEDLLVFRRREEAKQWPDGVASNHHRHDERNGRPSILREKR